MNESLDPSDPIGTRRTLHRHPEPSWCEYWTTAAIVEALDGLEPERLAVGPDVLDLDRRMSLPDAEFDERWRERALDAGADPTVLEALTPNATGCLAEIGHGEPTIVLRVDIDALPIEEADDPSHEPTAAGFRSSNEGWMHACGHDAHAAIGLGVLARLADADVPGTVRVLFQPAEEVSGGGAAMAAAGVVDDADAFLAVHVGLGYPTGTVVGGFERFLAVSHLSATFLGRSAHAGATPEEGQNAIHAAASAIEGLYGIPRHSGGVTRVNVGEIDGGTAPNIVADRATIAGEVRGGTTPLMESMRDRAERVIEGAASMHGCDVRVGRGAEAPSGSSDEGLASLVTATAEAVDGVETAVASRPFGASEDATYLMGRVQEHGGRATYVGIGTDHPGGNHTPTFDVDDRSIEIAVATLAGTIETLARGADT